MSVNRKILRSIAAILLGWLVTVGGYVVTMVVIAFFNPEAFRKRLSSPDYVPCTRCFHHPGIYLVATRLPEDHAAGHFSDERGKTRMRSGAATLRNLLLLGGETDEKLPGKLSGEPDRYGASCLSGAAPLTGPAYQDSLGVK
jgi:hypothetical protein